MSHLLGLRVSRLSAPVTLFTFAMVGCQAGSGGDLFDGGGAGGTSSTKAATGPTSGTQSTGAIMANSTAAQFMTGGSTGSGPTNCTAGADEDKDQDGFTINQGDCNDCDANVNPAALEVVVDPPDPMKPPADEDCDGTIDNPPAAVCDTGLMLTPGSAMDAAKAIELCKQATGPKDWGVVSAKFTNALGTAVGVSQQVGIMPKFGDNIPSRAGDNLFVLSSGHARTVGQNGACNSCNCGTPTAHMAPPGFPQDNGCGTASEIYDDIALDLQLRAPSNATGYGFDFRFFTFEYPDWVCSAVNDQFITLVNPPPMGSLNGNIAFDNMHNPVSVNIAFFDVCDVQGDACNANAAQMKNTGFDTWSGTFDDGNAGGTSWLRTTAPIQGGQTFEIRFTIWDTGDNYLNSTAMIDNFGWVANGGTVVVGTNPVPQ